MKSCLVTLLAICLTLSCLGCAAWRNLNTYPPGYEPSSFEKTIGPPMWYLNEAPG
jgi:hypothetical protein